jgi:hypothetical protein
MPTSPLKMADSDMQTHRNIAMPKFVKNDEQRRIIFKMLS